MKILLLHGITDDDHDCIGDLISRTSCNEERNPLLSTSASYVGRIVYHGLDSVLQCRTAIFCCVAEECLVLCLRNCILGKFFLTILTFPCCN